MTCPPDTTGPASQGADAPLRAFFALRPDAGARAALAALSRDVAARMQGRAPAMENMHLTLAFLGDVSVARVGALRAIGAAVAAAVPPFALALDRVGTFRGTGIAWAGSAAPPIALVRLAGELCSALTTEGFAVDRRPFHAHVTLARKCRKPGSTSLAVPIAWTAARLTLNASELASEGPRYRDVAGWPLGAPGGGGHTP